MRCRRSVPVESFLANHLLFPSPAERIRLAEDLWGSVAAETGEHPLTDAQAVELDRRLAGLARDPGAGQPWEVVRGRIEQPLHQAG